jgi:hypothetical protein
MQLYMLHISIPTAINMRIYNDLEPGPSPKAPVSSLTCVQHVC